MVGGLTATGTSGGWFLLAGSLTTTGSGANSGGGLIGFVVVVG